MSKKVIIIGASSGLGRRLAELYAEEDCMIGVMSRRGNLLKELELQYPGKIFIQQADIANENIGLQIKQLIKSLNGVDIIIIAASVIKFNNILAEKPETETTDINVRGFTKIISAAWEHFLETGHGHIVGITSIAAARGNKAAPAYHASKAFQSIYLESLRVKSKYERNNISITELIPGYIDTAMGKGDRLFWVASPDKAARESKKAIDKKKARAFITKRWWLVYHLQRLLPIFIYDSVVNGSWKLKSKN
ncbi:hypothetical protein CAP36_13065 [Chitinophagaceae bacterium IBVUCB2]|nr:hypothetical protein CAP36_13065 [Chitinophagaceae bacterium IBVUCB2]